MAARDGMTNLILELRLMTETADNDETVDGVAYWTDEQLQSVLDRHSIEHTQVKIKPISKLLYQGTYEYRIYPFPDGIEWVERGSAVTSVFVVQDNTGVQEVYDTEYTVDYDAKRITFVADTGGDTFLFSFRAFDLNKAAAEIWFKKLSLRTTLVNWKTDNHTIYEDQEYQHCKDMYLHYAGKSGGFISRFVRTDERLWQWRR